MKIGVIGLGKLGSCLAQVLTEHNEVVGVDLKLKRIEGVQLTTTNFERLKDCEVIFNVVNTPSLPNGDFSNKYLFESINQAYDYIHKCKVFVIVSTIMPGTCEQIKERLPWCKICYNPEFIRLNSIIEDMKNPDFILIGEEDEESGDVLEKIYNKIFNERTYKQCYDKTIIPIKHMSLKSAELAKISLNSYITMKISFANTIGRIAKKIGADADKILDAIGQDHRIGTAYFKAGGAYGGPCFPRDNRAFFNVAGDIMNYSNMTDIINKQVAKEIGYFSDDERYQNV